MALQVRHERRDGVDQWFRAVPLVFVGRDALRVLALALHEVFSELRVELVPMLGVVLLPRGGARRARESRFRSRSRCACRLSGLGLCWLGRSGCGILFFRREGAVLAARLIAFRWLSGGRDLRLLDAARRGFLRNDGIERIGNRIAQSGLRRFLFHVGPLNWHYALMNATTCVEETFQNNIAVSIGRIAPEPAAI